MLTPYDNPIVKVQKLDPRAKLPKQAHRTDAGFDLFAIKDDIIYPGKTLLVRTGIAIQLPLSSQLEMHGLRHRLVWEAQVRPRSGLARDHGITVLNSPGTIDMNYRGEIGVILINHSGEHYEIKPGLKIAQLVFNLAVIPTM